MATESPRPDWERIDTVLLDMDGTLLDLGFDLRFWRDTIPRRYAGIRGIALKEAVAELQPVFQRTHGTLDWYCIEFWSRELGLDIPRLKRAIRHEVTWLPGARDFVAGLRAAGRRVVLVTNAHPETLAIKDAHAGVTREFDAVYSSHEFRVPKESREFWPLLAGREAYAPERTLFADDTLPVLTAARNHGIAWVYGIRQPTPDMPRREFPGMPAVDAVHELAAGLEARAAPDQSPDGT